MTSDLPPDDPDGLIQVAESTWAVYARTAYDGEVIIGEYHDLTEARAVFCGEVPQPSTTLSSEDEDGSSSGNDTTR